MAMLPIALATVFTRPPEAATPVPDTVFIYTCSFLRFTRRHQEPERLQRKLQVTQPGPPGQSHDLKLGCLAPEPARLMRK